MTGPLNARLVLKEGRALAPIWLGAAVTMVAAARTHQPVIGLFAFVLGTAALGVFSIGHEYAHRTLTSLLAQPLSRSRLLLSKLVVLAPLLVVLSLLAALALLRADVIERVLGPGALGASWRLAVVVLTPLLGLCVAPWLTMVCRSAMGGLVFTLAVPAGLWIVGQITRAVVSDFDLTGPYYGNVNPFAYEPALTLMVVGVLIVSLVAVGHGRALFLGLEALDAPRDIAPAMLKRSTRADSRASASDVRVESGRPTRRYPLVMLAQKEVRLHALSIVLAALSAFGWIAMRLTRTDTLIAGQSFESLSALYGMFLAMLLGATASADERALGTAEWQMLQPLASWKQSAVKVTIVCLLTLSLGLVLPIVLEASFPLIGDAGHVGLNRLLGVFNYFGVGDYGPLTILLIALFSLYVSTLCAGGLRALLVALPLSFSLTSLYLGLLYGIDRLERIVTRNLYGPPPPCTLPGAPERTLAGCFRAWWTGLPTVDGTDFATAFSYNRQMTAVAFIGFAALILFMYLRNSRSGERGSTMARKQLPWVVVYVVLAAVVVNGGHAVLEWWLFTH